MKAGAEPLPEPMALRHADGPMVPELARRSLEEHVAVRCKRPIPTCCSSRSISCWRLGAPSRRFPEHQRSPLRGAPELQHLQDFVSAQFLPCRQLFFRPVYPTAAVHGIRSCVVRFLQRVEVVEHGYRQSPARPRVSDLPARAGYRASALPPSGDAAFGTPSSSVSSPMAQHRSA